MVIPTSFARWTHSALALLAAPAWLAHAWWSGREHRGWRGLWSERLALGGRRAEPGALWLHAHTAAEVKEVGVLLAELRRLNPSWRYLITHGEAEGRAEGARLLKPGDVQAWVPLDTAGATRRFFRRHRLRVGVLMERLPRPNLLHQAAAAGVPMMMANARLTATELETARRRRSLLEPAFRSLILVLAQSDTDARRLAQAGAQHVRVFGNLRFDVPLPAKLIVRGHQWRQAAQAAGRKVVLAAGTRPGEEALLLDAWRTLAAPRPLLVIVPHRAQRLAKIGFAVREHGFSLRRRSMWGTQPPAEACEADVWLGDSRHEMAVYYAMADVALLGGSFHPAHGGQSLVEAAACGCPVLMGPHTSEYENVADLAIAAGAAERHRDFAAAVPRAVWLAADARRRDAWVRNAMAFTAAHGGAVKRVVAALLAMITTRSSAAEAAARQARDAQAARAA